MKGEREREEKKKARKDDERNARERKEENNRRGKGGGGEKGKETMSIIEIFQDENLTFPLSFLIGQLEEYTSYLSSISANSRAFEHALCVPENNLKGLTMARRIVFMNRWRVVKFLDHIFTNSCSKQIYKGEERKIEG